MSSKHLDADSGQILQKKVQAAFTKIFYGEVSDVSCPYCDVTPVRFSYSCVEPERYRIWISCTVCHKEAHLRLVERPPGFDEKYVIEEFQKRDEDALSIVDEWWHKKTRPIDTSRE